MQNFRGGGVIRDYLALVVSHFEDNKPREVNDLPKIR